MWPFKKRPAPEDRYGPHIVGAFGIRWRIQKETRGNGDILYVVQRVYSNGKWSTLSDSTFETMQEAESQLKWWMGYYRADEITQSETVFPSPDPSPPCPGAITGIRKAETPCADCIDGWCQMNCGRASNET